MRETRMTEITPVDDVRRRQMPVKECGGLFCGGSAPSTTEQIVCDAGEPPDVVGWCGFCKRYVCGRCALRQPAAELESGRARLACRYCGVPLGTGRGAFLATARSSDAPDDTDG